jgi:methionyl aminopeptidase
MEQKEIDDYIKAGRIAAEAREYGKSLIKIGENLLEVTEKIEEKIISLGGDFAFPPQISINSIAAHFCPDSDDKIIFKEGDVVKIDVGVHINGCVGDTASTVILGNDPELKKLQEASREALNQAIKLIKPGMKIGEIGKAIEETIRNKGFNPVINLSGHGLNKYIIHDSPSIPNIDNKSQETLKEGQVIAIEPFASTGSGIVYESGNSTLFALGEIKPVRSPMTREVLRSLEEYNGLPFTKRWLVKKHGLGKTSFALREMKILDMIREYPPLQDKAKGLVSQAEHTIIVKEKPIITTFLENEE